MVSRSMGARVLRSMTSAEIPSFSAAAAAFRPRWDHRAPSHDRQVAALPDDAGLAEGDLIEALGDLLLPAR